MRLANPFFLLLFIPLAALLWLYIQGSIGKEAAIRFSNVELVRVSGARNLSFRRIVLGLIRGLVIGLMIFALARPQTGEGQSDQSQDVVDIVMAIDVSSSMATIDFHPDNRLEAAKVEAQLFIDSRKLDRIGMVTFAKHSITISPLTTDHSALASLLKQVDMGLIEDGTAIGVGLANALNRLKDSETKSKVVVLLTDGVNNSGEIDPVTAGDIAKELGIRVYTIGMGKDGYAMVPINHPRFGRRLVQAHTVIDEDTLKDIARKTKGAYFRAQDEVGLRNIFKQIDALEKTEIQVHTYTTYEDHFPYFLSLAFWVLLGEIILAYLLWRKVP